MLSPKIWHKLIIHSSRHCIMKETRSHCKSTKRCLRSTTTLPVCVLKSVRQKAKKKSVVKRAPEVSAQTESQCNSCFDLADKLFSLPCNHMFCKGCVRGLFLAALDDQSLMPVKCCGKRVDQRLRRVVLTLEECDRFEALLEELEAPNSMYCPKPECSTFHNLNTVSQSSTGRFLCSGCNLPLCANCHASHSAMTCAAYKSLPAADRSYHDVLFFKHAQKSHYAQCNRCRRFIEHRGGCNNMYCRCGNSFIFTTNRFTGSVATAATAKRAQTKRTKKAAVNAAYAREEAACAHTWRQYNHQLEEALPCHLCRRHKRCYQVECSQCYMRACPSCAQGFDQ